MARKSRSQRIIPNQPNHLIVRGNNRRRLFSYMRERMTYLRLLGRALEEYRCQLHAMCLMLNHVHLLLTPATVEGASRLAKRVNQRYAQIRNQERGGSGKLFEQSFESVPIEDDAHLAHAVMYIDANPHRAGCRDAWTYDWSTYALHAGDPGAARIPGDLITLDPWYRSLGGSPRERAETYREAFRAYLSMASELDEPIWEPQGIARGRLLRPDGTSAAEPGDFYVWSETANDDDGLKR
jgi:putative transposase